MSDHLFPELDRATILTFLFQKTMAQDELSSTYEAISAILYGNKDIFYHANGLFFIHINYLNEVTRKVDAPILLDKLRSIQRDLETSEAQAQSRNPPPPVNDNPNPDTTNSAPMTRVNSSTPVTSAKTSVSASNSRKNSIQSDLVDQTQTQIQTQTQTHSNSKEEVEEVIPVTKGEIMSSPKHVSDTEHPVISDSSKAPAPRSQSTGDVQRSSSRERLLVRMPLRAPRIELHYFTQPLISDHPVKVARKEIVDDTKMYFIITDKRGKIRRLTIRQANKVHREVETFEHKTLNRRYPQKRLFSQINELLLLSYYPTSSPPSDDTTKILGLEFEKLHPLPIGSKSTLLEQSRPACFICRQYYRYDMITCQHCELVAHKSCLPDDDIVQEWVNEQEECHYCTEHKYSRFTKINELVLKEFVVPFMDKMMTFQVPMYKVLLESNADNDEKVTLQFPIVWIKLTNPELAANQ